MATYYFEREGKQIGPMSLDEILALSLDENTQIWKEGLPEWVPLKSLPELKKQATVPPPLTTKPKPSKPATSSTKIIVSITCVIILTFLSWIGWFWYQGKQFEAQEEENQKLELLAKTAEEEGRKSETRLKLPNLLKVKFDKIDFGVFGGVPEFGLTLTNNTNYNIEVVRYQIDYILASGEVFQTEYVDFTNLAAGESQYKKAISSERGVRVSGQIFSVTSSDLGL